MRAGARARCERRRSDAITSYAIRVDERAASVGVIVAAGTSEGAMADVDDDALLMLMLRYAAMIIDMLLRHHTRDKSS